MTIEHHLVKSKLIEIRNRIGDDRYIDWMFESIRLYNHDPDKGNMSMGEYMVDYMEVKERLYELI